LPELDKYPLTNIHILDSDEYEWAKQKANELGYKNISELIFDLLLILKENPSIESKLFRLNLIRQLNKVKLPEVIEDLEEKITDLLKTEGQKRLPDFEDKRKQMNENLKNTRASFASKHETSPKK
jgi:hypothetical protein